MSEKPTLEQISAAVRSSGYLFEQEVATRLETLGYQVTTNLPFIDPDEGKSRELDVLATKHIGENGDKFTVTIQLLIECKNSRLPFVLISRKKGVRDRLDIPREIVFPVQKYEYEHHRKGNVHKRERPAYFHFGLNTAHYDFKNEGKHVQFCRIERRGGGWKADHAGLYDSIFMPLIKAFEEARATWTAFHDQGTSFDVALLLPVLAIQGELYSLVSETAQTMPIPQDHLTFIRTIKSGKDYMRHAVEFVTYQGLDKFVLETVEPFAKLIGKKVNEDGERFLERTLRWYDSGLENERA